MLDFQNVSKMLGGKDILKDVSLRINKGERVGIVGPNGTGKTTLFRMITGEMSPDSGEIMIPERLRLGYLHQQLAAAGSDVKLIDYVESAGGELPAIHQAMEKLEAELAAAGSNPPQKTLDELGRLQSRYEQLGGYEMRHRAEAALDGLGFAPSALEQPLNSFSGGWQMRAAMVRVLLGEPDILLLDEPSNYLDIPAVEWLQRRLKTFEGTLLLISHDRFLLNTLTDVTVELNNAKLTRYSGNYTYYAKEREARKLQSEAEKKNIERRKQQLQDNINRFRAKATKAAQVQSWIKMLEKIKDTEIPEQLQFHGTIRIPAPPPCGAEVFRLENVTHSYDGKRNILKDLTLSIDSGDKLGIIGYNGMGKTTLLRIIAGRLTPSAGNAQSGHKVVVGYQAQEFAELLPAEETAFQVVRNAAGDLPSQRIREILGAFGFSGDDAMKQCSVLSGGEKIRLCFARIFVNPPNLLILDEPTTHLDINARIALQDALRNYQGTVCLVSHDVEFIRGSVSSILEIRRDGVKRYQGGYDYYREKKAAEEGAAASSAQEKTVVSAETVSVNQKDLRREKAARRNELAPMKRRLEKEVARLEKIIEDGEAEKASLMESFADPALPASEIPAKQKRLKELDYDISKAMLDWETAAAELEEFRKEYDSI